MSRELLQQALGALGTSTWDHTRAVGKQELITALRAALAQPEPEPVALMALHDINELMHCNGMSVFVENPRIYPPYCEGEPLVGFVPLYATPPAPAVAEPLSDERIDEIFEGAHENVPKGVLFRTFIARAIEQAHGIGGGK